jgi:gamma-glutamyl hydrolase
MCVHSSQYEDGVYRGHHSSEKWKTFRPLVGIVSQGGSPAPKGSSYIAASYIKFVESAGARAVPILHDMTKEELERIFYSVNGILIPGGGQDLSPGHSYYDTVKVLFDLTVKENDKGILFPMHGTCLGFEALAVAASGNTSVLATFDAEDYAQPLYPTEHAEKSRFFTSLPPRVVKNLYEKPYAMQNHMNGVSFSAFAENPALDKFFEVLTLSIDREKNVYVSTMEAKEYPISATQWHPEKNAFEWTVDEDIPHHPEAIEVTQEVANSFVDLARQNSHAPKSSKEEEELLIYNWSQNIVYSGKHTEEGEEVNFDQIYVFPDAKTFSFSSH